MRKIPTSLCLLLLLLISSLTGCHREEVRKEVTGQSTKDSIVALRDSGKTLRDNSRFEEAIDIHRQGLEMARRVHDTLEITQALNNLGTDYRRLAIYDIASNYHHEALELTTQYAADTSFTNRQNRMRSLNGIGNIYLSMRNLVLADSALRQALDGERQMGNILGQAINLANLGSVYEEKGQTDSAWAYYRRSMRLNEEVHSSTGIALCHTHFGSLYERENRFEEAIGEYRQALQLMETSDDEWHRLKTTLSLVRLHIHTGAINEAQTLLDEAFKTATSIKSLEHLETIHHLYYQCYKDKGQVAPALNNLEKAILYEDSIHNEKRLNKIEIDRVRRVYHQHLDKIQEAEQRYQLERTMKWTILGGSLLFFALATAAIFYVRYRTLLRMRDLLQKQEHYQELYQQQKVRQQATESQAPKEQRQAPKANSQATPPISSPAPGDLEFMHQLRQAIRHQIDRRQMDLQEIASELHLNRQQLNRRVKMLTELSTSAYITAYRVEHAKHLLTDYPDMRIGEVAMQCGIDDVAYFSRIFRQTTGLTPTQFAKK